MTTSSATATIENVLATEAIVSSDSHIIEPPDLWEQRLPAEITDRLPKLSRAGHDQLPGGTDGNERVREMAVDGVSAEVLYPTLGLRLFALEDPALQEAGFRASNDYMAEYCSVSPERLWGVPLISTYNPDNSIRELERCAAMGLKGALLWQVPPEDLRFNTMHYERFWAACQEMEIPVNVHIVSGFDYSRLPTKDLSTVELVRNASNTKLQSVMTTMFDLIFSGVFDRYPRLRVVFVENEIGWIPFALDQWDKYVKRFRKSRELDLPELPSAYFDRQIYATFFNDPPGTQLLASWGADRCMWSSDFPHGNTTWPDSHKVIAQSLGHLPIETVRKVIRENVVELFGVTAPTPIQTAG
jgi:predicted TIM-barrel fold metal-dependent hydrolase